MEEVNSNEVSGYKEKRIRYSIFSTNKDSRSLAIMFPGLGYTVHGPLFHFATGLYLNKGIDVLQLEYPYGDSFYEDFTYKQLVEAVIYDSGAMIDHALKDREYENFYLIGKSLGTIAMSNELKKSQFKDAKAVWLTPLLKRDDVWSAMKDSSVKGLCFIGDHDHQYIEDRFKQLDYHPSMKTRLYPKVYHGMDYEGDILKSIDVLKDIIGEIDQF
ncbi:hypothetical protein [Bacillus sp. FJAT-27986]|uniref:hypothetical protein n=1 Tax=Bacillus sp. FJAT-27986 TaxID=1743146 RepID=UPI00080AEDD7|nr:hypothetical protein [Bacillus sp. FJAT-27986]OCA89246.1 hypothetical protein A8L44_16965 [Bacillus sp. FJAT-27986]